MITLLEDVQRRATKSVKGMEYVHYKDLDIVQMSLKCLKEHFFL